jgi:tetratricopeptide (TPR) repeat protein
MAASYHHLGRLAQDRGDYDEAARQYQRSLDITERIGNQSGLVASYGQLGVLAQDQGDYDEAARQYQRSLDIAERLGEQAAMATCYYQLGSLAQYQGDYDEAARQYQRSLDIKERLGDQAGIARSCSQFGVLERERGGLVATAVEWHVKALLIRLNLGVSEAGIDLRYLAAYRGELGAEQFTSVLTGAVGDPDLAGQITSLLDQLDENQNDAS